MTHSRNKYLKILLKLTLLTFAKQKNVHLLFLLNMLSLGTRLLK